MENINLCYGQKIDESLGILYPWYTHGCLSQLNTIDFKTLNVLEYGGGASSRWWRHKAKYVCTVEANKEWSLEIDKQCTGLDNGKVYLREINEGDQTRIDEYLSVDGMLPPEENFGVIIVDGVLRTEAVEFGIDYYKSRKKEGLIIADNWYQDYVWLSPKAVELVEPYKKEIYLQVDHKDHSGNPWKTAIIYLDFRESIAINQ